MINIPIVWGDLQASAGGHFCGGFFPLSRWRTALTDIISLGGYSLPVREWLTAWAEENHPEGSVMEVRGHTLLFDPPEKKRLPTCARVPALQYQLAIKGTRAIRLTFYHSDSLNTLSSMGEDKDRHDPECTFVLMEWSAERQKYIRP